MAQKQAIIIFTRVPIPGKTKTRLQSCLTPQECSGLHTAFILDVFQACQRTNMDIYIYYTPSDELIILQELLGDNLAYHSQQGKDLGEKMHNALVDVLKLGYDTCGLIGTDIPLVQSSDLEYGFSLLESNDIVISPTFDGGYYFVGIKQACAELFNIEYGHGNVFMETVNRAKAVGKTCAEGSAQFDVDDENDLKILMETLKKPLKAPLKETPIHTIKALKEMGLWR